MKYLNIKINYHATIVISEIYDIEGQKNYSPIKYTSCLCFEIV